MAEFQMVMSEYRRLCEGKRCTDCPIWEKVDKGVETFCSAWLTNHSEEAECIIMRWAAEHPVMKSREKFREVFGMDLVFLEKEAAVWLDQEYKGGKDEQN